ncbi:MAG: SpoIID/LytB domain-containing protein [Nocardioidaceae bacterium]
MRVRPLAVVGTCLAAVVATLATGAGTPATAVTTDQAYWVPVTKQLVVRGHGYGHGHGMSQYGAYGAALQGLDYRQIVDFYYPGTTWSKVTGQVRVLITADTTPDLVVSPAPGLTVRDLGDGTTYPVPAIDGVTRWRLNTDGSGRTVVGYLTSTWHRWSPGGKATLVGDGQLSADGPLTLWTPSGARHYRGVLRAASPTAGSSDRDTVNVLSMDDYIKGVVPSEMPASWSPEAVRAQAVAARTYAAWSRSQNPGRYYQICDTASCQVYSGTDSEDGRSNAAVDATSREILTYGGKPAFTQFSSSSGGWTSAGSVPYLPAKQDPYDAFSGNPMHEWTSTIDASALERAYPRIGTLTRIQVVSRDGHGDWQGRVWSLVLDGTDGDQTISGETFRWMFNLRSTWFSVDPTPIIARWSSLGGAKSVVGAVRSPESRIGSGSVQVFDRGRIFYSAATGAHELYGPILTAYRSIGGARSRLRMPTTGVQARYDGYRAKFQRGIVYSNPRTGTVPVANTVITTLYLQQGGTRSTLGWPTKTNTSTSYGERVGFEHGWIGYDSSTRKATVHLAPR